MLRELIEKIRLSEMEVDVGEKIRPIDYFKTKVYCDETLEKTCGTKTFTKKDEFEVIIVTPQEIVLEKDGKFVVIDKRELSEFEDVE